MPSVMRQAEILAKHVFVEESVFGNLFSREDARVIWERHHERDSEVYRTRIQFAYAHLAVLKTTLSEHPEFNNLKYE